MQTTLKDWFLFVTGKTIIPIIIDPTYDKIPECYAQVYGSN